MSSFTPVLDVEITLILIRLLFVFFVFTRFILPLDMKYTAWLWKARCAAYMYTVAVADIESQRKGLVVVIWPTGESASEWKISMPDPRDHIGNLGEEEL